MWKSLELFSILNQSLFQCPFEYSVTKKGFIRHPISAQFSLWSASQAILVIWILVPSLLIILLAFLSEPQTVPLIVLFPSICCFLLACSSLALETVLISSGHVISKTFEECKALQRAVGRKRSIKHTKKVDFLGIFLCGTSCLAAIQPIVALIVMKLELDPVSWAVQFIFFPYLSNKLVVAVLWKIRYLWVFGAFIGARAFNLGVLVSIIHDYLDLSVMSSPNFFPHYVTNFVLMRHNEEWKTPACFLFHGFGFSLVVALTTGAVKAFSTSSPISAVCLSLDVAMIIGIAYMMPMVSQMYEVPSNALKEVKRNLLKKKMLCLYRISWKSFVKLSNFSVKIWRKKLMSYQPVKSYGGFGELRFYYNRKETQITYYEVILIYVVNAVLGTR